MGIEWLFAGMIGIVVVLAGVAGHLWWRVFQQHKARQRQQQERQARQAQTEQARIDYIYESLNVLARAVLDDQCPLTEGCIRMAVLMDNLSLDCDTRNRFEPIFRIYHATRHIPTHSDWQALDRRQRQAFKQEMFSLEKEHGQQVRELMDYIRLNPFGVSLVNTLN